jgi:hypothetical protein
VPLDKLPDPENNEESTSFSLNQEDKWLDLDLAVMTRHTEEQFNNSNI